MAASGSALSAFLKRVLTAGLIALCLFLVASALWRLGSRRTYRRSYVLGPAEAGAVAPDELARTVEVLRARIDALRGTFNIARAELRPLPPDRLAVELRLAAEPVRAFSWLTMQGRAEFRLLHPDDGLPDGEGPDALPPGYAVKVYRERRYVLTRLNELKTVEHAYAVQREPVLAVPQFERVELETAGRQKRVILTFELPPPQAARLEELTALHAGRRMAMLIDGEMFFPPKRIGSAVSGGRIRAEGFFHTPPLRILVRILNCGSLPRPLIEQEAAGGVAAR